MFVDPCIIVQFVKKNPTRCNNVSEFYYSIFIWSSTCFRRHTAHHQEPKTALAASGFLCMEGCRTCSWWTLSTNCTSFIYLFKWIKAQFAVIFVRINITFFPQHFLGLAGIRRRYSDYPDAYTTWNIISSIGSTISFVSIRIFLFITWERITSNRLILFPTHTRNSVEWSQNFPAAEQRYSELPTISLTN